LGLVPLLDHGRVPLGHKLGEGALELFHVGLLTQTCVASVFSIAIAILLRAFFLGQGGSTCVTGSLIACGDGGGRGSFWGGDRIACRDPILGGEGIDVSGAGIDGFFAGLGNGLRPRLGDGT
jgi:hypothetical protein